MQNAVILKKASETKAEFGEVPEKRSIQRLLDFGVVNIDKPEGPTSHQVSDFVQRILGIKKSGHGGSLDPKVTGVLPVALGKATRIVQTWLKAPKEYVCVMHLHKEVPEAELRKIMSFFVGTIDQVPPLKSSVKRVRRKRNVYYLTILEIDGKDVLFQVGCEAGTYIRKLCHDIGLKLGGAHMANLRRTKAGPFDESTLVTLHDLSDAFYYYREKGGEKFLRHCIHPPEEGISHLQKIWVHDTTVDTLCHGADLSVPGISRLHDGIQKGSLVAVMTLKDELVCLAETKMDSEEIKKKEKGLAAKTAKVFMEPGLYPKYKPGQSLGQLV